MRPIKYRAWDEKTKKIRAVNSIAFHYEDDAFDFDKSRLPKVVNLWGTQIIGEDAPKSVILNREAKDVVLMQFTGLLDKNGKEIYEGDVVLDREWLKYGNREVRFGEQWIDASDYEQYSVGTIGFYLTNYLGNKDEYEGLNSSDSPHLEVIGNIYSNPELLNHDK